MKVRIRFFAVVLSSLLAVSPALAMIPEEESAPDPARDPVVLAVQKVVPAVVNISTERPVRRQYRDPFEDLWRQFFGQPRRPEGETGQSLGSGVIVDEDGWIVTNYHVIQRADKINVVLSDGSQYQARYVSGDEKNDLALLKIDAKKPLPYVEIASDQEPLLGETVIAIGNPFGLDHTVTKGIISAKNRRYDAGGMTFEDILQTDAAINPGNSGGPLINTRAQLVGINMAILSQAEGIGFAIPARRVANMLAAWFSPEKHARLWLGLQLKREAGKILITDVQADSPAAKAGLAARDKVVAVDDSPYADVLPLLRHFLRKKAGDAVRFAVDRGGKLRNFEVKLAALPKLSATDLMWKRFGLQIQPLTRELADALGIPPMQGVLVSDVQQGGPGATVGFRRGIVITHVGGEGFQSMDQLAEQLAGIKSGDMVSMAVFIAEQRAGFTFEQTTGVTLQAR
ncbi:MAG: trypsin-like peptidase domain-containing protein [Verrucomicrobiia bacterium]